MTGSLLFDFLINLVVLCGIGALIFVAIPKVSPDAFFTKIAQIAVGVALIVALLIAVKGVLFGGPTFAGGGYGIIIFAIALIVALLVITLVNMALDWIASQMGMAAGIVTLVKYVIGGLVLIALLYVAGNVLFGIGAWPVAGHSFQSVR